MPEAVSALGCVGHRVTNSCPLSLLSTPGNYLGWSNALLALGLRGVRWGELLLLLLQPSFAGNEHFAPEQRDGFRASALHHAAGSQQSNLSSLKSQPLPTAAWAAPVLLTQLLCRAEPCAWTALHTDSYGTTHERTQREARAS